MMTETRARPAQPEGEIPARGLGKRPAHVTRERWQRGEVEIDDHADPDRPMRDQSGVQVGFHTIRGARAAQGGHAYLRRRGSIDDAQFAAAARYVDAWHGCERSGSTLGAAGTTRLPVHQQGHPTMAMLQAAEALRQVDRSLGHAGRLIVHQVAVQGWTLGTIGGAAGEGDQVTLGRLRAALDRLVEVWGIEV